MNGFIDFVSTICPITGNDLIDAILFAIITSIAFAIAWKLTGFISSDSDTMRSIHWIIRVLVFLFLLAVALSVINFIHWIGSWPWWVYLIIGVALIHVLVGIILTVMVKSKKKKKAKIESNYE